MYLSCVCWKAFFYAMLLAIVVTPLTSPRPPPAVVKYNLLLLPPQPGDGISGWLLAGLWLASLWPLAVRLSYVLWLARLCPGWRACGFDGL